MPYLVTCRTSDPSSIQVQLHVLIVTLILKKKKNNSSKDLVTIRDLQIGLVAKSIHVNFALQFKKRKIDITLVYIKKGRTPVKVFTVHNVYTSLIVSSSCIRAFLLHSAVCIKFKEHNTYTRDFWPRGVLPRFLYTGVRFRDLKPHP